MNKTKWRGTQAELKEEFAAANAWFAQQCVTALTDHSRSEMKDGIKVPVHAKYLTELKSELAKGTINVFYHTVERTGDGIWSRTSRERSDYYHVWKVRANLRFSYGDTRFVLRKDETLNMENLGAVLEDLVGTRLRLRNEADVHAQNKELYDQAGRPGSNVKGITIQASTTALDMFTVSCHRFQPLLKSELTVKVNGIQPFIDICDYFAVQIENFKKNNK